MTYHKEYTKEFLISELHRFVRENGRNPMASDMFPDNGYPSMTPYVNKFGSWNNALKDANLGNIRKEYTDKFLISEIHRFVKENERVPKSYEMSPKYGYPSSSMCAGRFGSWNKALQAAGLEIHKTCEKRTGSETCVFCGSHRKHNQTCISKGLQTGEVLCEDCYQTSKRDYKNGKLDVNSSTGFAFLSQRVVANALNLELKNDCNCSVNFMHPFDLYDKKKYGKIDVKVSKLSILNRWQFNIKYSENFLPDTYILLGFDQHKKNILRVWINKPSDNLIHKKITLCLTNSTETGLKRAKPWEVDPTPYNKAFHSMSIDNCSVLTYKE